VWAKTARIEFAALALSIQDPRTRTARKATEILKHVEFASQTNGKEFRSFHYCNQKGEIVINCANCVLVVSPHGMRVLSHSESYYFAGQMAASYRPDAQAPDFESAVQFSLPDAADVELLRCFSGYILMPDCRHEAALVSYGPAETGKGTVATGIHAALGDQLVTNMSLSQLSDPNNKNLAKLAGAALNLSSELDAIEVSSENFKQLVSGEGLDADRKFKDSISLRSSCKLWFSANHLPRFHKGTDAELRRLHFLRFDRKAPQRDETLKERIEAERDGVLIFMLDGLRTLLSTRKFPKPSERSNETKERFSLQNDPIKAFVEAQCKLGPEFKIPKTQLFNAYANFCEANGIPCEPNLSPWFFRELLNRYQVRKSRSRSGGERLQELLGIDLNDD
jgi:putative DNA primase/helicase